MLDDIKTLEQVAHPSYKDLEIFDFNLILDKNVYTNLNSLHFVFPIKIKKKANVNNDIGDDLITPNNFFAHWIKEISITKYGTHIELIPTATPQEMLKHVPKKSLDVIQYDLLYSQDPVVLTSDMDSDYIVRLAPERLLAQTPIFETEKRSLESN